jgi:tRNA A37 threonylcarbamoyladenosine dehydratase
MSERDKTDQLSQVLMGIEELSRKLDLVLEAQAHVLEVIDPLVASDGSPPDQEQIALMKTHGNRVRATLQQFLEHRRPGGGDPTR